MSSISISGNFGDIIYALSVIRSLPKGPHDLILVDNPNLEPPNFVGRAGVIKRLIEAQPYVKSVKVGTGEVPDLELVNFREAGLDRTKTLAWAFAKWATRQGFKTIEDTKPWLSGVEPHSYSAYRVIVSRSHRYRNPFFPWKELVAELGEGMLFVGTRDEHRDFEEHFGWVEYMGTKDLMEVAELIAGADLVIGNQSSPCAIAIGLGVELVQETSPWVPDCIYKRDNATYFTGLPFKLRNKTYGEPYVDPSQIRTMETPPGQWQYQGERRMDLGDLVNLFWQKDKTIDRSLLKTNILMENVTRCRGFFQGITADRSTFEIALSNAGYP